MRRFIFRSFDIFILLRPHGHAIGTLFVSAVACHELARAGHHVFYKKIDSSSVDDIVTSAENRGTKDCYFTATFYTSDGKS
jgi:hypothetical protein